MKNALMPLTAMVGLILGAAVWPVNATPAYRTYAQSFTGTNDRLYKERR
jgi:hypothetical protein